MELLKSGWSQEAQVTKNRVDGVKVLILHKPPICKCILREAAEGDGDVEIDKYRDNIICE